MATRKEIKVRKIPAMTAITPPPRPGPTYNSIMIIKVYSFFSFGN
jgi:hypothetical protein